MLVGYLRDYTRRATDRAAARVVTLLSSRGHEKGIPSSGGGVSPALEQQRAFYRQEGFISSTIILSAFDMRSLERFKSGTFPVSRIFAKPTVISTSGCLRPKLFFKACSAFLNSSLLIVILMIFSFHGTDQPPESQNFLPLGIESGRLDL